MLTIFTFGYWGWGNATGKLIEVVDWTEHVRGFEPPVFVDIRLRRNEYLAWTDKLFHRSRDVLDWHVRIDPMLIEEVNLVRPETLEAAC